MAYEDRISRHFVEGRRAWYLVLQIGFPADSLPDWPRKRRREYRLAHASSSRHLTVVGAECELLGVTVRRLNISVGETGAYGHYLFRFRRYHRDDEAALRLVEAFTFGFSLAGGPLADTNDSLVWRVPDTAVRGKRIVKFETLVDIEESRPPQERSLTFPNTRLAGVASTTTDRHEIAWRVAAITYKNSRLFDATRFLQRSYENFYVYPGQLRDVMSDDSSPASGTVQNNFEDALHSAFKAIEAVIGDPPKDDRKFFEKLQQIGVDPNEEIGFLNKSPIQRVIRRMNEARDKKSAHGSTPNRGITPAELLEFQACADLIVTAAVEKVRGRSLET